VRLLLSSTAGRRGSRKRDKSKETPSLRLFYCIYEHFRDAGFPAEGTPIKLKTLIAASGV